MEPNEIVLKQLSLVFQPLVDLSSGRVVAAEALLRWQHPTRGTVPPDTFIPRAEASGAIHRLGRWVLDAACAQAAAWRRVEGPEAQLAVAINVSPYQLWRGRFDRQVANALDRHGLPADALHIEVTESAPVQADGPGGRMLRRVARLGVEVQLDDFGAGYASIGHLRTLPLQAVKLDRALIAEADGDGAALLRAVVSVARAMGLHTVAEGVETSQQAALVREMGVEVGQGWWFARPGPAEAVARLAAAA